MSIFAIGDPHLARNARIEKPMDVFGPAWSDHDARLAENWRRTVSPEDTVIVAGDISWALKLEEAMEDLTWLHDLPGEKVLIKGNHDLWWHGITHLNTLFSSLTFLQNSCYVAGDYVIAGARGWICPGEEYFDAQDEKIYRRELLRLSASLEAAQARLSPAGEEGPTHILGVLHYPPTDASFESSGFTDLFAEYGVREVVYGHLHGREGFRKGLQGERDGVSYRLVSLDYVDATPVPVVP